MTLGRAPSNRGSTFPRVHQCSLGLPFPRFHSTLPGCFSGINHGEPWCRVFQGSSQHSWLRGRGVDFFNWYTWQSPIGHVLLPVHGGADCNLISTFPRAHQCSLRLPFPRFHVTSRGCIGSNIQVVQTFGHAAIPELGFGTCDRISTFPSVHQSSLRLPFPRFHSTAQGCISAIITSELWFRFFQGSSRHSWFRGHNVDFPGGYTWFHGWRLNISSTHLGHATLWQGMAYKGAFSNLLSTFPRVHQSSIMLPFPRFHSTLKGCFGSIIHGWH